MHRFFVPSDKINGNFGIITGDDAYHIQRVLRLEAGDKIILCDGRGMDYQAVIQDVSKGQVQLELTENSPSGTEPNLKVTLLQGLPKASKMETIIQKCVELGIHEIIPITTSRTVVRIADGREGEKKAARWQRVAEEAAKQSRRGILPQVHTPRTFDQAIQACQADWKIILWEEERKQSLRRVLQSRSSMPATIAILIGSEGGLEEKEVFLARQHGWIPASLGPRILRTETAGMATLAAIMYQMEELE
jgi:16S rRNA (uracil1498-N3)-methyltransferase